MIKFEDLEVEGRFYGKYRGRVTENIDPLNIARVKIDVPALPAATDIWALPCVPYAGNKDALVGMHIIPPVGAHVWVEFEGGDPSHPIWVGCYWDEKDEFTNSEDEESSYPVDLEADEPPLVKILKTDCSVFAIDDAVEQKGSIKLEIGTEAVENPVTMIFNNDGALLGTGTSAITVHPENGITLAVYAEARAWMKDSPPDPITSIILTKDDIQSKSKAIGDTSTGGDITASSAANLAMDAAQAASLESGTTLGLKAGSSGTLETSASLTVKGGASTTVQAGASLDLKGGGGVNVTGPTIKLN